MSLTNITFPEVPEGSFFVTITLKPSLYGHTVRKQFIMTVDKVEACLRAWASTYWLVPELTKQNNIHYHAIVKFNDNIEYAKEKFIDTMKTIISFGFVHIGAQVIENVLRTWNYLIKDLSKTSSLINMKKGDYEIMRVYKMVDKPPKNKKIILLKKLIKLDKDNEISDTEYEIMTIGK